MRLKHLFAAGFLTAVHGSCHKNFGPNTQEGMLARLLSFGRKVSLKSYDVSVLAKVFPLCWSDIVALEEDGLSHEIKKLPMVYSNEGVEKALFGLLAGEKTLYLDWLAKMHQNFDETKDNYLYLPIASFLPDGTIGPIIELASNIDAHIANYHRFYMIGLPNLSNMPLFISVDILQRFRPNNNENFPMEILDIYGKFISYNSIYKRRRCIVYVPYKTSDTEEVVNSIKAVPDCTRIIWPFRNADKSWGIVHVWGFRSSSKKTIVRLIRLHDETRSSLASTANILRVLSSALERVFNIESLSVEQSIKNPKPFLDQVNETDAILTLMQHVKFLALRYNPHNYRNPKLFVKGNVRRDLVLAELTLGYMFDPNETCEYVG